MKHVLALSLLLLSFTGFAQSGDTTARARARLITGERSLRILAGDATIPHRLFTITKTQVFPFRLEQTSVYALPDSLSAIRGRFAGVGVQFSALQTQTNNLSNAVNLKADQSQIVQITGRLNTADAVNSEQTDSINARIRTSMATALFATKATTFTKTEVENKLPLSSVRDLALAGGFALPTDGTSDARAAIQYALNNPGPSNGVRLPVGIYKVSWFINVPGGIEFKLDFGAVIEVMNNFPSDPLAGGDGRYVLRVLGANVRLENITIDCRGLQAAPVVILFADDVTVTGCTLRNWRIGGLGQHGIAVLDSKRARILNNTLINGEHGINNFNSFGTLCEGNDIQYMVHGGMYNVNSSSYRAHHNIVRDCGDNGADSEGGEKNVWDNNIITRCKNGEINIFEGDDAPLVSNNLVFRDNTLTRVSQYTTMNATGTTSATAACDASFGAVSIMSLDEGCFNSGAEGNIINVYYGYGFYHTQLNDKTGRDIYFRRNTITAYPGAAGFYRTLNSESLTYEHNTHIAKAGTESMQNEMRDAHAGRFSHNDFWFDLPKTTNYCSLFNTSDAVNIAGADYATLSMIIDHNTYYNCGTLAQRYDPFQNGLLTAQFWANDYGTAYTTNGGFSVSDNAVSGVRFRDQPIKILLPEGSNNMGSILPYLEKGGGLKAFGSVSLGNPQYNGAISHYAYMSGTGSFVTTLGTKTSLAISIGQPGSVLQLDRSSAIPGGAAVGYLDMVLNSY